MTFAVIHCSFVSFYSFLLVTFSSHLLIPCCFKSNSTIFSSCWMLCFGSFILQKFFPHFLVTYLLFSWSYLLIFSSSPRLLTLLLAACWTPPPPSEVTAPVSSLAVGQGALGTNQRSVFISRYQDWPIRSQYLPGLHRHSGPHRTSRPPPPLWLKWKFVLMLWKCLAF